MSDLGIYVYGLVSAGSLASAPELPGVDAAQPVECVTQGAVCALVSRVDLEQFDEAALREHLADMAWVEQTARTHQRVLDAVLDLAAPIPMRLCTVYHDEEGLREMLDRDQADFTAVLSELSGKLEWGVQAFTAASHPTTAGTEQAAPATPTQKSGTDYLRKRLAALDSGEQRHANLERVCDQLHAELCASALAGRVGVPHRPELSPHQAPMILNAFYLVANDQRTQFRERVAELQQGATEHGIELQLTGPWAPYNFVPAAVGGAR